MTRLISRAGRVPTGVDRVEAAYLRQLVRNADAVPVYGLACTALGYVLLDRAGLERLQRAQENADWPFPDFLSLLNRRLTPEMRRGQTLVRRHRTARCSRFGLAKLLERHLPPAFEYLNVGHSNVTRRTLTAIRSRPGAFVSILIHDTIPLDFPEWQRPEGVARFRSIIALTAEFADRVICTARATAADVRRHLGFAGRVPDITIAPLGIRAPRPDPVSIPAEIVPKGPYFVTVGTIEPRKNHDLLLDVWGMLDDGGPQLLICGARGWAGADLLERLDAGVADVVETGPLSDPALAALVAGSRGLLFPSFVEGFGLPPAEAAALGVPVICADLDVYREFLPDSAIYLDPNDRYSWKKMIERLAVTDPPQAPGPYVPPTWEAHFNAVFTVPR